MTRKELDAAVRRYRRWNRKAEAARKVAAPSPQSSQCAIDEATYYLGRNGGNRPHVGRVSPDRQADNTESHTKNEL